MVDYSIIYFFSIVFYNSMTKSNTLIVVVGPTAVGKTALSIKLAQHFNTAIISADSRQFYKEMNIGTAKPSSLELSQAPHYFISSHSISEEYSAGDFEREALTTLSDLFKKNEVVIAVGGSGLFVKALTDGLDNLPKASDEIRSALNLQFKNEGLEPLKKLLEKIDPDYYAKADVDNPQRVIRAIEVYEASGNPISFYLKNEKSDRSFRVITIGLNTDRQDLYDKINLRVDLMMKEGLLDEVKSLQQFRYKPALLTVGYAELFDFLDNKISLSDAVSQIKQNSRRYAKRQITWFKKYGNTVWFEPQDEEKIIQYLEYKLK